MNGGKWVTVLNNGTNNNPATPAANTKFRSKGVVGSHSSSFSWAGRSMSPFNRKLSRLRGTSRQTMLGKIKLAMMVPVVNWPPIHNMVVVTSPIGDQAPPAFAATTTMPAKSHLVCLSSINLRNKDTMTMEVVKLSNNAEKKNVKTQTIQSILTLLRVVIRSVMTLNPSCASTNSTMVIAPIKKNRIDAISSMWCSKRCSKNAARPECPPPWPLAMNASNCDAMWAGTSWVPSTKMAQHRVPVTRAEPALSMWMLCSRAMNT